MPKGYWIGRIDVRDEEGYKPYIAANGPIFKKFGAKLIVRRRAVRVCRGHRAFAQRRDRISRSGDRESLLPLSGISGQHQTAAALFNGRHRHYRGRRRLVAFSQLTRYGGSEWRRLK